MSELFPTTQPPGWGDYQWAVECEVAGKVERIITQDHIDEEQGRELVHLLSALSLTPHRRTHLDQQGAAIIDGIEKARAGGTRSNIIDYTLANHLVSIQGQAAGILAGDAEETIPNLLPLTRQALESSPPRDGENNTWREILPLLAAYSRVDVTFDHYNRYILEAGVTRRVPYTVAWHLVTTCEMQGPWRNHSLEGRVRTLTETLNTMTAEELGLAAQWATSWTGTVDDLLDATKDTLTDSRVKTSEQEAQVEPEEVNPEPEVEIQGGRARVNPRRKAGETWTHWT